MAVVHVTDWASFKAAIEVAGNEVIVDNDIVCDEFNTSARWRCAKVDGNDHAIYSIQTTHTGTEFASETQALQVNKLHFLNFVLYGDSTAGMFIHTDYGRNYFVFNDCKFQGMTTKSLFGDGCDLNRCSITLTQCRSLNTGGNQHTNIMRECWADIGRCTPKGNDFTLCYSDVYNCYFKGTIIANDGDNSSSGRGLNFIRGSIYNSIFNCYVESDNNHTFALRRNDSAPDTTSIYNTSRIGDGVNFYHAGWSALTDSELKTASAVAATGFPIII